MPSEQKFEAVAEIKEKIEAASAFVLADYRGLDVKEMQEWRRRMREADCEVKIFKNRLTKIALEELGRPAMDEYLDGPTAFVFSPGDPVAVSKGVVDFAKEHDVLEVKGGFIDAEIVDASAIHALAALPSREELVARFMGSLLNPVRGFMTVATAPPGALVRVIKAVADQKEAA